MPTELMAASNIALDVGTGEGMHVPCPILGRTCSVLLIKGWYQQIVQMTFISLGHPYLLLADSFDPKYGGGPCQMLFYIYGDDHRIFLFHL
jgi:hypothetical protein